MPIRLTDLLAKVPVEVEAKVKRARDQNRSVVQEALRSECRLVMRTSEEAEDKKVGTPSRHSRHDRRPPEAARRHQAATTP
jgi:hypothetical protein